VLKRLYDLHKRRREGNDLRPILAGLRSEDEAEQREALRQLRQLASQGRVNAIYALESLIESVADTDPEDKLKLADYLRRIGTKHGGVHALHSVAACLEALRERSDWAPHAAKATERGNWARASALLAATYVAIGERQGSRRRLLEAITLCDEVQAAIGSNPRESATTWEIMQDARALALLGLAKMENDRERIDDAVKLSMDAVKLRGKRPEQLARVYNILGKARMLQSRHQAARDAIVIQQALAAHTTAAKLVRKENNHEVWAETQHLRAKALMANAGLPNFGALLDEAQQCLANATTVWARESSPMDWANVQCDLGLLLHQRARLATKPRETRRLLHDSVMVLTEALKECRAIRGPSDFARVSHSLGNVLVHRGQLDRDKTSIARGTRAIADALASSPRARDLFQWATAQGDRGKAHQVMWKLTSSEADREEAETAYKRALDVWTAKGEPRQFKDITGRLAEVSRQPAKQAA
jgi:tetratricopeptide (TPR) repeat protein